MAAARSAPSRIPRRIRRDLTPRQRKVLEVIRDWVERFGYPPSVREIGDAVGLTSTSSVHHQLRTLERKGYLRRDPHRTRAVDVRGPDDPAADEVGDVRAARPSTSAMDSAAGPLARRPEPAFVPLLGDIAAGGPILAEQAVQSVFPLPREIVGEGELFLLNVRGDSMVEAAIRDGDWVVVRQQPVAENGEIVAAMIDGEATVEDAAPPRRARVADAGEPRLRPDPGRRGHGARAGGGGAAPAVDRRLAGASARYDDHRVVRAYAPARRRSRRAGSGA